MGNNIGKSVNQGIARETFMQQLEANGVKVDSKKFKNAMSIFDKYAGDDKILDEQEQVQARSDFAQLNLNDDNNVGRSEYNKKNKGKDTFGTDYSSTTAYMEAMNAVASDSRNGVGGEMTFTNDGALVTYGTTTDDVSDDVVRIYTKDENGSYTVKEPEAETVPDEAPAEEPPAPEAPKPPTFKDVAELHDAVVRYLLGMGKDEAINIDVEHTGMKFSVSSDNIATVEYNGKKYTARFNSDNKLVFENDEGEGSTLQRDLLNAESTDEANNYRNRGDKNNLQSNYDAGTGEITNTSGKRQGVSQVQTFASMIMNNNEDSTLRLDGQIQQDGTRKTLDGQAIIDSIDSSNEDTKGKITKSELMKFLYAAYNESRATTVEAKPGTPSGSRIYAPNVDLDIKDLANIGVVFDKYAGEDNMLDASELQKLLSALKDGSSMSKLAGTEGTYKYQGPPKPPEKPEKPEKSPKKDEPFKFEYGDVAKVNLTRANTSGGSVTYIYSGGVDGTRIMVADDGTGTTRIVKNANITEYKDHGLFGMGEKEFLVIQGLEQNVRSEVVSGKAEGPMVIEVKDASGNKTFRQVSYDAETRTYSQGAQVYKNSEGNYRTAKERTSDGLELLKLDTNLKLPKGFSFEYDKKGKIVCKFNGATVSKQVARVMIMKVNVPETK